MKISYEKLMILLKSNGMSKGDLQEAVDISFGTMAKFGKCEPVSLTVLLKICDFFMCDIGDIMEVIHE